MAEIQRALHRELFGFAMFDFANSSYTTVIITVVFCVTFPRLIVGDEPGYRLGNFLWSASLSASYLIVLLTAPLLGAIMDYAASKKMFLFISYILTVLATASLYFVEPGCIILGMLLIILSNIGFSYSEAFISSFLPGLGPPSDLGRISGYAWGLGYVGGLLSTAIVIFALNANVYTLDNFSNLRLVGPVTGLFFLIFAIPTFLWVTEKTIPRPKFDGKSYFLIGFDRLKKTLLDILDYKDLIILLSSFFFAYAGLSIVISFAFIYGDQVIQWSGNTQVFMFIITQVTAAAGAFLFGFLQDTWNSKKTYLLTLIVWTVTACLIYGVFQITDFINKLFSLSLKAEHIFLMIATFAGLGLGSTQSACRAMVGLFAPNTKAGEFFGLWSLAGRLSSIVGLMALGVLQAIFGLQKAVLVCSAFFLTALIFIVFLNEERGMKAAHKHNGE
jgi:MFS transporter, UMF1 family